ncbi:hypothetical protein, partial [Nocardia blacklockiae]|uniref:hypothetical protein n=1 Tax=Nocardia blacklockiae TaxID=480036 RepID=UPI001895E7B6
NANIERVHLRLLEICRSLAADNNTTATKEIYNAVYQYNNTFHSTTKSKPVDLFFQTKMINEEETSNNLHAVQLKQLEQHNRNRIKKEFKEGDEIYIKQNRRGKETKRYKKGIVKQDLGSTVKTKEGYIVHKDRIRSYYNSNSNN